MKRLSYAALIVFLFLAAPALCANDVDVVQYKCDAAQHTLYISAKIMNKKKIRPSADMLVLDRELTKDERTRSCELSKGEFAETQILQQTIDKLDNSVAINLGYYFNDGLSFIPGDEYAFSIKKMKNGKYHIDFFENGVITRSEEQPYREQAAE